MSCVSFFHHPLVGQERAYLVTSITVLLLGMMFTSRGFPPGTIGYNILSVVTAVLIVASVTVFVVLLCFEVYRSIRVSGRGHMRAL